ncbi:MAG: hypothetical protein K6E78_06700 [Treponema sp.]|nr:hypothetical protein [Treponema sp.]
MRNLGKIAGFTVLLMALLAGCSNVTEAKKSEASGKKTSDSVTVSGKVLFAYQKQNSARSAVTSFNMETVTGLRHEWKLFAVNIQTGNEVEGIVNDDLTFSLELNQLGTWRPYLSLFFYTDEEESAEVFSSDESLEIKIESFSSPVEAIDLILYPRSNEQIKGSINLTIYDYTSGAKISTVRYYATDYYSENNNPTDPNDSQMEKVIQDTTVVFSGDSVNDNQIGYVNLNLTDINAGCYEFSFFFEDSEGTELYSCKESIVVLSGFTTDAWFGEGSHLKKADDGSIIFKITDADIENNLSGFAKESPLYVFDKGIDGTYSFYNAENKESGSEFATSKSKNFSFDSNGNLYVLSYTANSGETASARVYSNNADFDSASLYSLATPSYTPSDYGLAVDRANDKFYSWFTNYDISRGQTIDIFYYPDYIENHQAPATGEVPENIQFSINCRGHFSSDYLTSKDFKHKKIVIYNDTLYDLLEYSYNGGQKYYNIYAINISSLKEGSEILLTSKDCIAGDLFCEYQGKAKATVATDMLYQENFLYVLGKAYCMKYGNGLNEYSFESRGLLLRVDSFTGKTSSLGWLQNADYYEGKAFNPSVVLDFPGSEPYNLYDVFFGGDNVSTNPSIPSEAVPVYGDQEVNGPREIVKLSSKVVWINYCRFNGYDPANLSPETRVLQIPTLEGIDPEKAGEETVFLGPESFIALKPKKLVIADNGIAFYTDDDGLWGYKNQNRIVTVDLEHFFIESTENAGVNFNDVISNNIVLRASGFGIDFMGTYLTSEYTHPNTNTNSSDSDYSLPQLYNALWKAENDGDSITSDTLVIGFECKDND